MFTIFSRLTSYDNIDHSSFTHKENLIGLFSSFYEAKMMARKLGKALANTVKNPTFYEDQIGVSVSYPATKKENVMYLADEMVQDFLIKEIGEPSITL